jgi:hypothetical protein
MHIKTGKTTALRYLDVNASNVATSKELNCVPFPVQVIVINRCVISCIPVKHKLAVVQSTNSLLFLDDSQVTFLSSQK